LKSFNFQNIYVIEDDDDFDDDFDDDVTTKKNKNKNNSNSNSSAAKAENNNPLSKLKSTNLALMQIKKILTTKVKFEMNKDKHINCYLFSKFDAIRVSSNSQNNSGYGSWYELHIATPISEKELIKNLNSINEVKSNTNLKSKSDSSAKINNNSNNKINIVNY